MKSYADIYVEKVREARMNVVAATERVGMALDDLRSFANFADSQDALREIHGDLTDLLSIINCDDYLVKRAGMPNPGPDDGRTA